MSKRFLIAAWFCLCGLSIQAAWLPDVTEQALAELGVAYGTPQISGFVFIEGRYIPPPYTVTRRGNGIFINRIQVEQPVPWTNGTPDSALAGDGVRKTVDADGDFEEVSPTVEPVKQANDIDELFNDIGTPAARPEVEQPESMAVRGPEQIKLAKEAMLEGLERLRKGYEVALGRGEIFFFGSQKRVNGNYGSARTMMGVLPKALRQAQSPQELHHSLRQGGVFFIDIGICGELYRNRTTFPLLEERLKKIEESEALEEARRNKEARRW
ncbi:MAG: hypothetical protein PHU80_00325 [Kiritimatiellae bacterium]|nr:hypothetical protein [Kiritimatiellia bacterium]